MGLLQKNTGNSRPENFALHNIAFHGKPTLRGLLATLSYNDIGFNNIFSLCHFLHPMSTSRHDILFRWRAPDEFMNLAYEMGTEVSISPFLSFRVRPFGTRNLLLHYARSFRIPPLSHRNDKLAKSYMGHQARVGILVTVRHYSCRIQLNEKTWWKKQSH